VRPSVVACDLDGTLLRSDGTVDERSRRAIMDAEAAGALVVLCTARPTRWMRPLAEALRHHGVAICANGAVVWDLHRETVLEAFPLEPDITRQVVALLQEALPGGAWAVERTSGFAREAAFASRWPSPADTVIDSVQALICEPAVKLMLRHDGLRADALLERAREVIGQLAELTHSNSNDGLLEISAAGVSKASTLARLCEERGVGSERVIAFGDMPNDLPMLQWAGHSVAVANAHPDVRAAATEITSSNDKAGVAAVLERVFASAQPAGVGPRAWDQLPLETGRGKGHDQRHERYHDNHPQPTDHR
jgi:Cof subfamily protein (haloacid dehalogenase superfamily)